MKRRDALKNIGLAAGFAIATPSIFSLLQSCTPSEKPWVPKFFTQDEKEILTNLVDIILPKTETTPSATEVKVPQFIDIYIDEVLDTKDQELTRLAFSKVINTFKPSETSKISDVTKEQYTAFLDKNMLIKGEDDKDREANPDLKEMTTAEFLGQIKWLTISAFTQSELVGETILHYDPVPTEYYCGDLQEVTGGKSHSL